MLLFIVNTLVPIIPRRYLIFRSNLRMIMLFTDTKVLKSNFFLGVVVNNVMTKNLCSQSMTTKSSNAKRSASDSNTSRSRIVLGNPFKFSFL